MATATLYINNSDVRYLDKELTKIADVSIIIKDDTNISNPDIIISNENFDGRCNYIYIDIFNRYYTIQNISYSKQRYVITLKRDSKTSFSSDLKKCDCIASRSSNLYNSYLNDDRYTQLGYNRVVLHKFDNSFSKNNNFILTIAGGV